MTELKWSGVGLVLMLLSSPMASTLEAGQVAAPAAERGAAVYAAQKCAMCHALDGKGQAKGPLDGVGSKLTVEEIRQWILTPVEMTAKAKAVRKPAMKPYPNLPKEDLDALVAFLASKKKA